MHAGVMSWPVKEIQAPLRHMIAEASRENATLHWRIEGLAVGLVHSA